MIYLYRIVIQISSFLLPITALFSQKMKLFVDGRKNIFTVLTQQIKKTDQVIWFHAASLGEYEQGLPVIKRIKKEHPTHKIVLTFFSPSGYEVRKNTPFADVVCYLPMDTQYNVKRFLNIVHPKQAFFIKYEYWPNYLFALQKADIPIYMISGIFNKNQIFFKWYGQLHRQCLATFTHFFVQDQNSKQLLNLIEIQKVTVNGDTRFDRVSEILQADNTLDYVEQFIDNQLCVVIGSSWMQDEVLLVDYINASIDNVKWIIAPHNIKSDQIQHLKKGFTKPTVLFSEKEKHNLSDHDVFIVDTIGILTKIYSYASVAYVGGGFSAGIHNVLEPATFGIPILIGPNYHKFKEAVDLVGLGACISVSDKQQLYQALNQLITDLDYRKGLGKKASYYVQQNAGATEGILSNITDTFFLV